MEGAGIEQGGGGRDESEGREYFVKLNGAAPLCRLRPRRGPMATRIQKNCGVSMRRLVDVEQIAIKNGLYAQVLKVFIALGF